MPCIVCGTPEEYCKGKCKKCYMKEYNLKRRKNPEYIQKQFERAKQWREKTPHKTWARNTLYNHKQRGFEVNILLTELTERAKESTHCQYCGKLLNWTYGEKGRVQHNSPVLDRFTNNRYMTNYNTVICCSDCSFSKGEKSVEQWKKQMNSTIKRLNDYERSEFI